MKASASYPKTSDMVLVHKVFRREFVLIPRLIRSTTQGDTARARQVGGHLTDIVNALRHHHDAERELVWPRACAAGAARRRSCPIACSVRTPRIARCWWSWTACWRCG